MAFGKIAVLLAVAAALASAPVQAERLAIEGVYAARTDAARGITAITLAPQDGNEGFALEGALADQLGSARIHGEPYFRLEREWGGPEQGDRGHAQLEGYAESRIYDLEDGVFERTTCLRKEVVGKEKKKKCVESLTETFECRRLFVAFRPEVALIAARGTLYQRQDRLERSERYCADSTYIPSAEAMLKPMIARFARVVRLDLAPEQRLDRYRILESRDGLERADRKAFKRAIKLTKTDPVGACLAFEDILTRNPHQRSALYNAALCREAEERLDLAAAAYDQLVMVSDKSRFRDGQARVNSRVLAREQLASLEPHRVALASAVSADLSAR